MKHMRSLLIQFSVLPILVALLPINARAQVLDVDSAVAHMGVGAGITFNKPVNNDGHSAQGLVFVYRWHSFHSNWGPTFGIDWHSMDFDRSLGTVDAPLGTLKTRAILVGYGHTERFFHRFSTSASVSTGYSFNDFSQSSQAVPSFKAAGVPLVAANVENSWVLKPDVALWYDVFRHVGVGVSAAYLLSRPHETLTTANGVQVDHLNADTFELTVGVVVGVWKKKSE